MSMRKSLVALGLLAALLTAGTAFAEQTAEPVVDLADLLAAPTPVEMAGPGVQCGNVVCGKGYQCGPTDACHWSRTAPTHACHLTKFEFFASPERSGPPSPSSPSWHTRDTYRPKTAR
jgi:hypothetical protein